MLIAAFASFAILVAVWVAVPSPAAKDCEDAAD
jgi:hypothetical protein